MNRRERRAAGKHLKTVKNVPHSQVALVQAGLDHLRAGRFLDAQLCGRQAIAVDPDGAEALYLMGLLSFQAQQFDAAVEWTARAIQQDPKPQYLFSLGTALRSQGRLEEARQAFEKATQLSPEAADLWRHLANVLTELNRADQALQCFRRVLELSPRDRDASYNCGSLLLLTGRLEEAVACFNCCEQWQPDHWQTLQKRAVALYGLGRFEEALADISRAHALDATQAEICNNAAVFLQRLNRYDEALPWFDRALERRPDYPAASTNKAATLTNLHRFTEALAVYEDVGARHPDLAEAEWGRALLQLLLGNFADGWAGREVRYRHEALSIARFSFVEPIWLGKEPIEGKTILIHVDEGLGDVLQFVRYVPMVAARGARVILVVQGALCTLLSGMGCVAQCMPLGSAPLPPFDMYCPISSLPLAFGTALDTVPCNTPYLPLPAESRRKAWEDRLGSHDRLRIGLVWSGNPQHKNDHNRSLPLRALSPILDCDATFVSLQKDPNPDDRATLCAQSGIIDLTADLTDFVETSALVCCLDLVIAVDTSVAHLAGALGRPTWILLPYTPDYRWLLDRDDSPWYPTARLFRQSERRDYAEVLSRVRDELSLEIAAWSAGRNG
jgi:tetratricopeptide (TPR) repeat protein